MVVVSADGDGLADIVDINNAHAAMPAAREQTVAQTHGVVQAVLAPRPGGFFAPREVLAGDVPARHFLRLGGVFQIIDNENVANVAGHLGRDVGVLVIHVEAVHAATVGFHVRE